MATDDPRAPIPVDPDRPHGSTGAPEPVTEQPDLGFERKLEAKWLGDVMGMRLAAVALARRARRKRGEEVLPLPWLAMGVTAAFVCGLIALGWLVVSLLT
ncbi:MAG TPA: hypothetical protein VF235_02975 [Actinomycetota bacterium]